MTDRNRRLPLLLTWFLHFCLKTIKASPASHTHPGGIARWFAHLAKPGDRVKNHETLTAYLVMYRDWSSYPDPPPCVVQE